MTSEGLSGVLAAAHELKTPLALISHMAAALGDPLLSDVQRQLLTERIRVSADQSLRLVQGLTVAERFEDMGRLATQFRLQPVNVGHICQEALHELTPLASAYNQSLVFTMPSRTQLAVANPELLKSVCYNLVDNAIRYTSVQSGVVVSVGRQAGLVRLGVADSGPGLRRNDLAALRERLGSQLQPLSTRPDSSGLGLYIASRMMQIMGGSLGVGRRQTKGTVFYATLLQSKQLRLL